MNIIRPYPKRRKVFDTTTTTITTTTINQPNKLSESQPSSASTTLNSINDLNGLTTASSCSSRTLRSPVKRALMIGIKYGDSLALASAGGTGEKDARAEPMNLKEGELRGPHRDVLSMREFLIDTYAYKPEDITVLLDAVGYSQPTRVNIVEETKKLIGDAQPGDTFFFHYCGHGGQVPNRTRSEEDGMDECLIPCDAVSEKQWILDNELRRTLVDPLPVGSNLIAVFDSCHSESLLDLYHSNCNRVWVPWISKGRRRSKTLMNRQVKRFAVDHHRGLGGGAGGAGGARSEDGGQPQRHRWGSNGDVGGGTNCACGAGPGARNEKGVVVGPRAVVATRRIYQSNRVSSDRVKSRRTSIDHIRRITLPSLPPTTSHTHTHTHTHTHKSSKPDVDAAQLPKPKPPPPHPSSTKSKSKPIPNTPRKSTDRASPPAPASPAPISRASTHDRERERWVLLSPGITRCESPIAEFCTGNCRHAAAAAIGGGAGGGGGGGVDGGVGGGAGGLANVISIGACKDEQFAWEDEDGASMTAALIDVLSSDPHPTYKNLMLGLSHRLHALSMRVHDTNKVYKQRLRAWREKQNRRFFADRQHNDHPQEVVDCAKCEKRNEGGGGGGGAGEEERRRRRLVRSASEGAVLGMMGGKDEKAAAVGTEGGDGEAEGMYETDNFQDPQLSSHLPLDMDSRFQP